MRVIERSVLEKLGSFGLRTMNRVATARVSMNGKRLSVPDMKEARQVDREQGRLHYGFERHGMAVSLSRPQLAKKLVPEEKEVTPRDELGPRWTVYGNQVEQRDNGRRPEKRA